MRRHETPGGGWICGIMSAIFSPNAERSRVLWICGTAIWDCRWAALRAPCEKLIWKTDL